MISAPAPTPEVPTASQPTPAAEPAPLYTMAAAPDASDVLQPLASPPLAEGAAVPSPPAAAAAATGASQQQAPAAEGAGLSPTVKPAPVSSTAAQKQPSGPSAPARQGTARQGYWDNVQPDQISNFACGIGGVSPHFQVGRTLSFLVFTHLLPNEHTGAAGQALHLHIRLLRQPHRHATVTLPADPVCWNPHLSCRGEAVRHVPGGVLC